MTLLVLFAGAHSYNMNRLPTAMYSCCLGVPLWQNRDHSKRNVSSHDVVNYLWHAYAKVHNGVGTVNHEHGTMCNDLALVHWQGLNGGYGRPHLPCRLAHKDQSVHVNIFCGASGMLWLSTVLESF